MKRAILILLAAVAASEVLAARLDVDGPSTSAMNGSNALDRAYAQARATDAAKTGSNYTVTVSGAVAKAGTNYAAAVGLSVAQSGSNYAAAVSTAAAKAGTNYAAAVGLSVAQSGSNYADAVGLSVAQSGSNYAAAVGLSVAQSGSNYAAAVSTAAAKAGTNYADAVKGYCRNAANLTNSVPLAQITNAIAQLRSPQVVTYSYTNVYTDARLGTLFRVYVTNDFRLHAPTGPADGQSFKYWFVQWVGGTNTITTVASEFLPPEGASGMPVLSVSNLWNDVWLGTWDARINKVRIESFMRYRE